MKIKISQIKIKNRFRKDLGDISALAESIRELGQLQPIAVDSNYRLIFGERRIRACELLGMDEVEGNIIHLENTLKGEFAENEFSEGWKVSERVAILKAIETVGQGARTDKPRQNFAEVPEVTKDEAAKKAGFGNKETARQATKVVDDGVPELVEKVDAGELSVSTAATIAELPEEDQEELVTLPKSEILAEAKRIRQEKAEKRRRDNERLKENTPPPEFSGRYDVVVIDPPWPMQKIERDVRPNQVEFDYPISMFSEAGTTGCYIKASSQDSRK